MPGCGASPGYSAKDAASQTKTVSQKPDCKNRAAQGDVTLSDGPPAALGFLGDVAEPHSPNCRRRPDPAATEARAILALVRRGVMNEVQARELIGVPPEIAERLRAFAAKCPSDGPRLLLVVEFRARVLAEFDRQIQTP